MVPWKAVFSKRLEPKHQSLLWLMQQGAVTTALQMVHLRPDTTRLCPVCNEHAESLTHYFFECPRVREYWRLVGRFLDRIQRQPPRTPTRLTLKDVVAGWAKKKRDLPNANVFHALAVWQVYRAHTEATQDGTIVSAISMLARWQGEVIRRIHSDLINARRKNLVELFIESWTSIRCQWFTFDGGGGVDGRGRLVFNHCLLAPAQEATTSG
jgi:hypothetical protein